MDSVFVHILELPTPKSPPRIFDGMEYWIPDSPPTLLPTKRSKNKKEQPGSTLAVHPTANGLILSSGDAIFSATLKKSQVPSSILEWDFVQKPRNTRIKTINTAYKMFPATRPATHAPPALTLRQKTEQAARFLRTHYPDLDIPFELLREQILADEKFKKTNKFDPLIGNQLAVLTTHDAKAEKRRGLLAFPTGVLGNELNVSPIYWSRKGGSIFAPDSKPAFTFETPIQHIVGSTANYSGWHDLQDLPPVAVRTHAAVYIMSVMAPTIKSIDPVIVKAMVHLTSADLGGTPNDVALSPFSLSAGLISSDDSVFRVDWKETRNVVKLFTNDGLTTDRFTRLAWTRNDSTVLLAHSHHVQQLDSKAPNGSSSIVFASPPTEHITAIEGAGVFPDALDDHIFRLTTTQRIVWMDHRYSKQPVLSWKHQRSVDRTLEARTCWFAQDPLCFLTSRENGLVTIYSVDTTARTVHSMGNAPQVLRTLPASSKRRGCGFFMHPCSELPTDFTFLELSDRGAIYSTQVLVEDEPSSKDITQPWTPEEEELSTDGAAAAARIRKGGLGREWSLSVEALEDKGATETAEPVVEEGSEREKVVVDFSEIYKDAIRAESSLTSAEDQPDMESVYQTLERMPHLWQGAEYPLETILTTGDIALASGPEPSSALRSDFLKRTTLHSAHGYRAFKEGHFPSSANIARDAAWSFDLRPSMKHITGLEIPSSPEALLRFLERYESRAETPTSRDTKQEGLIEEVALDLALSMDVFSAVPLVTYSPQSKDSLNDDELERATQALSITDDSLGNPPPVVFNFLRPRYAVTNAPVQGVESDKDGSGTVELPLGVCQLLTGWKLGEDPNQFIFRNPYEEHEPTFRKKERKVTGQKLEKDGLLDGRQVEPQTRSRIPVVVASSHMPPAISTQQTVNRVRMSPRVTSPTDEGGFDFGPTQALAVSQPLEMFGQGRPSGASSQTWLGPSTQVLPGAHGGRPEANIARKKPKKRAKGF